MKKISLPLYVFFFAAFILLLGAGPFGISSAHAQTSSGVVKGASCAPLVANGAELACASGLECDNNGICNPTPANNSVASGGWCGSNNNACTSGLTCNDSGICADAAAQTTAQPSTSAGASTGSTGNFVALTNIPVLNVLTDSQAPGLPVFLNAVYKYMIGIAATLAVIEIMYAGIQYMGGDSITETKQARARIQNAVLGLVIVLAPALVFGFINPNILNLNLSCDFDQLGGKNCDGTSSTPAAVTPAASTPAQTTATPAQLPNYGSSTVLPTPVSNASSVPAPDNNVNAPTTIPFTSTDNSTAYPGAGATGGVTPLSSYGSQ